MLDLVLFGALKKGLSMRKEPNKVAGQLDKIFRAFYMVSTSSNIRASFEMAGLTCEGSSGID